MKSTQKIFLLLCCCIPHATMTMQQEIKKSQDEFITAVTKGDVNSVNKLLEDRINANMTISYYFPHNVNKLAYKKTILTIAAEKGFDDIVTSLIKYGAYVNAPENVKSLSPLMQAVSNGHCSTAKILIDNKATFDAKELLINAAAKGCYDIVAFLIKKGVDVNLQNQLGETALTHAAKNGDEKMVNLLLDNEAIIDSPGKQIKTPLMFAAENGHTHIVELLINNGAGLNNEDKNGDTALDVAALNGHSEIVKILLAKGANIKDNLLSRLNKERLTSFLPEKFKKIMLDITFYYNSNAFQKYPDQVFAILPQRMQYFISWLKQGAQDVNKASHNLIFAWFIVTMPNITVPLSFSTILEKLSDKEIIDLASAIKKPINQQALEILTNFLLNKLSQKDAVTFLKFQQPDTETIKNISVADFLKTPIEGFNQNLNAVEALYLAAKKFGYKNIEDMIRQYMTTHRYKAILATAPTDTGKINFSFARGEPEKKKDLK